MSKKVEFYRQATLQKDTQFTVAWIDADYAVVGNVVHLKNDDGTLDKDWTVLSASKPMDAKTVESNSRNYLKQRRASDI